MDTLHVASNRRRSEDTPLMAEHSVASLWQNRVSRSEGRLENRSRLKIMWRTKAQVVGMWQKGLLPRRGWWFLGTKSRLEATRRRARYVSEMPMSDCAFVFSLWYFCYCQEQTINIMSSGLPSIHPGLTHSSVATEEPKTMALIHMMNTNTSSPSFFKLASLLA